MKHVFHRGTDPHRPTLLLLHGTGGNEHSLIPLAEIIDPHASYLSVRGNVLENGMPRFFRRLAEGVFDEEDLLRRTEELHQYLNEAAEQYGFDRSSILAVGFSNGANIAASLLFHYAGSLRGGILHHPMVPRRGAPMPDLSGVRVFVGAGLNDPLVTQEETNELVRLLKGAKAEVALHWYRYGHQLTQEEAEEAGAWHRSS